MSRSWGCARIREKRGFRGMKHVTIAAGCISLWAVTTSAIGFAGGWLRFHMVSPNCGAWARSSECWTLLESIGFGLICALCGGLTLATLGMGIVGMLMRAAEQDREEIEKTGRVEAQGGSLSHVSEERK